MKVGSSFRSTEFFALFMAHALVLLAPLVGYEVDKAIIVTLLGADITYILGRSGVKAMAAKGGDVKDELLNILKEAQK